MYKMCCKWNHMFQLQNILFSSKKVTSTTNNSSFFLFDIFDVHYNSTQDGHIYFHRIMFHLKVLWSLLATEY